MSHPANQFVLRLSPLVGIASILWPTAIAGNDATYAGYGLLSGSIAGLIVCIVAWPLTLLVGLGRDLDEQTRLIKLLSGAASRRSVLHSLLGSALCGSSFVVVAALSGAVGGFADWLIRSLGVGNPTVSSPSNSTLLFCLAAAAGGAVLMSCLILATRSGLRAAAVLATLAGSFVPLLFLVSGGQVRPWLILHPAAAAWALLYDGPSAQAEIGVPAWIAWASLAAWAAVLGWAVARVRPWVRLGD